MPDELKNPVFRWRYVDFFNEDGEFEVGLMRCAEIRKTPRGAWCKLVYSYRKWDDLIGSPARWSAYGKEFFVLDGPGKRRYHQHKKDAWESYAHRKTAQGRLAAAAVLSSKLGLKMFDEVKASGAQHPDDNNIHHKY